MPGGSAITTDPYSTRRERCMPKARSYEENVQNVFQQLAFKWYKTVQYEFIYNECDKQNIN